MKLQESLMTIIALAIGLSITLALIFFNFSLAYTLKLIRTGSVPTSNYLLMLSITAANTAVVIWLIWVIKKAQKGIPSIEALRQTARSKQAQPLIAEESQNTLKANHYEKQQTAKTLILSLAESQKYLTLNDITNLTGLNQIESQYLIDELVLNNLLKAESHNDSFIYRLSALEHS